LTAAVKGSGKSASEANRDAAAAAECDRSLVADDEDVVSDWPDEASNE